MPKSNKHFSNYLKNKNLPTCLLQPITEKEIMSIIGNISSRKAVGPNFIPNLILKELKSDSHPPKKLFICFNDRPSKIMKNAFYFILKAFFLLKIYKILS